jgi:hypothetical protein
MNIIEEMALRARPLPPELERLVSTANLRKFVDAELARGLERIDAEEDDEILGPCAWCGLLPSAHIVEPGDTFGTRCPSDAGDA